MSNSGRPNPTRPWLTPYLMVKDVENSMKFYESAFGMKKKEIVSGEGEGEGEKEGCQFTHGEFYYQDQLLMMGQEGAYGGSSQCPATSGTESPITLYLYCENVDDFYKQATKAGAESLGEPQDAFWGDRFCQLKCPNGYIWMFATSMNK